jgi:hypothetical protein
MENIMNARQIRRHLNLVRQMAHSLQYLKRSNIPWIELALVAKTPYILHWRHLEVYKVTNCEFKLAVMLIRVTLLSALSSEHQLLDE